MNEGIVTIVIYITILPLLVRIGRHSDQSIYDFITFLCNFREI